MKVAYLVNQYPKTSHTFIRREIEALENEGLDVHRFSVRRTAENLPDPADQSEARRTQVLLDKGSLGLLRDVARVLAKRPRRFADAALAAARLGLRSDRGLARNLAYLVEACALLEALESDHIDHLHAHFGTNPAAVAMLCRMLGGPPYSYTVHGPDEFDKAPGLSLDQKTHESAFVVAISSFCRSQLCRLNTVSDWQKIHVVRCGLGAAFLGLESTPVPNNERLLCIGRLSGEKGHLVLLEAFARTRAAHPGVELVLAGDGELRPRLEQRAGELGISEAVRFTGWISEAGVVEEIRESRALVLPSFAEGLPVVLMEALALGRPVVSTYIAGIPELVTPGKNGWLVPAGDVSALTAALEELLRTPVTQLSEMGLAGRQRVLERHDVRESSVSLKRLFEASRE